MVFKSIPAYIMSTISSMNRVKPTREPRHKKQMRVGRMLATIWAAREHETTGNAPSDRVSGASWTCWGWESSSFRKLLCPWTGFEGVRVSTATGRPRRTKLVSQLPNPVLLAASGFFSAGRFPENKIQIRCSHVHIAVLLNLEPRHRFPSPFLWSAGNLLWWDVELRL